MDRLVLPAPLDGLLEQLEQGAITNIFGAPGTGKTNICMLAMLGCLANGGKVTYIDTEGGFSFERLAQLQPTFKLLLPRINLLQPKSFKEQAKMIRTLPESDLIIVDSLSALYRLEYADSKDQKRNPAIVEANRELSKQMAILSVVARERNVPVLLTAHTFHSWDSGQDDVVGGEVVKYWSKTLLFLDKTGKPGERKISIVKHRSQPEGKEAKFIIVQEGIRPSGFRLF